MLEEKTSNLNHIGRKKTHWMSITLEEKTSNLNHIGRKNIQNAIRAASAYNIHV